jgi:topoisomerase-4 subunit B
MPADLKETTMDPSTRTLARVVLDDSGAPAFEGLVETLMGKKAEKRFEYIQEHATFVREQIDV